MAQTLAQRLAVVTARITAVDVLIDGLMANFKPTYTVDGQTFKWGEYLEILTKARKELLAESDALQDMDGAYGFEQTQVYVEGP